VIISTKFDVDTSLSLYDQTCCSVLTADTLRDLVTLTFSLLNLVIGHAWRATWSTSPPNLKILRLSVLQMGSEVSHGILRSQPLHVRRIYHVTYTEGQISPIYLKSLIPICLFSVQRLWQYNKDIKTFELSAKIVGLYDSVITSA